MGMIFISLMCTIAILVASLWLRNKKLLWMLLIVPVIFLASTIKTVPTGQTGVLITFGKVEDNTLEAGLHIISPFQNIVLMDNRLQKSERTESVFSKDIQETQVTFSINHAIDKTTAMTLYRTVGINYYDILVAPRAIEAVKNVFSEYSASDLITKRETLAKRISQDLQLTLSEYGISCSVNIEDVDFRDEYTSAVERKQVAEQDKLRAQTEQAQRTAEAAAENTRTKEKADADALAAITKAQADADIAKLNADADKYRKDAESDAKKYAMLAEAEGNIKLAESLTPSVIEYTYAQGWDGILPATWVSSGDTLPIINIGNEKGDSAFGF